MCAQRWDAAIEALDALPARARMNSTVLRCHRMALAISGRVLEALEVAERIIDLPDSDAVDRQHLAHIRLRAGRFEAAFDAAMEAIKQAPELSRPYAVVIAATALIPALLPRLHALLGAEPRAEPPSMCGGQRLRVSIPWNLPSYRPYSGPHPVITSALGPGCRFDACWADSGAALEPARALALIPGLTAWAERIEPQNRAALADFLVHRLPGAFFAAPEADLTFHHTVPFALDERPWVLHLEHLNMVAAPMTTYPTAALRPIDTQTLLLRERLSAPSCLGVFTHIRETKRRLDLLLGVPAIAAKTAYIRLGIDLEARALSRAKAPAVRRTMTTLLFTNSLARNNFHVRGGPDVLSAFLHLRKRHGNIRLLMRSDLPMAGAEGLVSRSCRHPDVVWIRERLSDTEIDALYHEADLFLLPSGLLHAVSIIKALRGGLALVASDVYGVDEFVRHRINGWVVPGRRAAVTPKVTADTVYAEDCRSLLDPTAEPPDPRFQWRFRAAIAELLDNPSLTAAIRRNARQGAAHDHRGHRWATDVSVFMERAMGKAMEQR